MVSSDLHMCAVSWTLLHLTHIRMHTQTHAHTYTHTHMRTHTPIIIIHFKKTTLYLFPPVPLKTKKGHGAHVLVASRFPEGCRRMFPSSEDGTGETVLMTLALEAWSL